MPRSFPPAASRPKHKRCFQCWRAIHCKTHRRLKNWSATLPVLIRRINIQHRIVYEIFAPEKTVRILRMWTHYE